MKKDTEETNLDIYHDTFTTLEVLIWDWTNRNISNIVCLLVKRSALKYISNQHANNRLTPNKHNRVL